jgi:hypothetical protein
MRGFVGIIVTVAIALFIGVGAYELGVQQGLATTGTAVAPAVYYHPWFFGGFGFLFPLLFLFFIFALMRAAFGGWGRRYGGWGGGYGHYPGGARERIEEIHRELHAEKPKDTGPAGSPPTGR